MAIDISMTVSEDDFLFRDLYIERIVWLKIDGEMKQASITSANLISFDHPRKIYLHLRYEVDGIELHLQKPHKREFA